MKSLILVQVFVFCVGTLVGQTVTGKIVDVSTGEPLVYVSIGVIGQPRGTITDETGAFELEINNLSAEATVRFSMIGYIAQTYTIRELSDNNGKNIGLKSASIPLSEVVIKPGKLRKIGVTKPSRSASGWGGNNFRKDGYGKGLEIGTKMKLGELPVQVKSLHIHFHKQTFDSCLLRLHVRNIVNELPGDELLNQNIYITITKASGWVEFDLSKYYLVFQGNIVLSLEWISDKSDNKNQYVSVRTEDEKLPFAPVIFFSLSRKGSKYGRMGSEAQWKQTEGSPCFYLTVK